MKALLPLILPVLAGCEVLPPDDPRAVEMRKNHAAFVARMEAEGAKPQPTGYLKAPAIQGSRHSNVRQLRVGMTRAQVGAIIGASQEDHVLADGTTCVSYLYDETIAPKFVHARFQGGALVRADDEHRTTCSGTARP